MSRVINMPEAIGVSRIDPWSKLIGLVVLLAVRDGATQVRFEPLRRGWRIFVEMPDGSCKECVPAPARAAVDRTIQALSRPGWAAACGIASGQGWSRLRSRFVSTGVSGCGVW